MAISRQDLELAKYILDQTIHQRMPLDLRDAIMLRAFLSALEEHQDRPAENVRSREWRAMVYRKLLDDPEALHQFTMSAMERFTPDQIAMMLHPEVRQAVLEQHGIEDREEESLEEILRSMSTSDVYDALSETGHLGDIIDWFIDNDPDYVRDKLGIEEEFSEALSEARSEGYSEGYEDGRNHAYEAGIGNE